jgi:surface carbohydrate biosynthesis protein
MLQKTPLIIPVENQLRELDPKLLLACVAVERGFTVFLGSIRELGIKIASFPRSIYLGKSMTARSVKSFSILKSLGHEIVVWDEEALVHHSKEEYFGRRLDQKTMEKVSALFAWGQENSELFKEYPGYSGVPVHITGNPRGDMMRPDVFPFYEAESESIREQFGDFILINTNFGMVNGFLPSLNLRNPGEKSEGPSVPGTAARGFSSKFAEGWADHKEAIFEHFKELVPLLSKRFPHQTIVVRPHPLENHDVWHQLAESFSNVKVIYQGNVLVWLQVAKAVIHNGCTTGIEAFIVKVPTIAYRPQTSKTYDLDLPNSLSCECFDSEELCQTLEKILHGEFDPLDTTKRRQILDHYISALDGPLACERIIDVIEQREKSRSGLPRPELVSYLKGHVKARIRSFKKVHIKPKLAGHRGNPKYLEQRFPGVSVDEVRARINRFSQRLNRFDDVAVEQVFKNIFKLHP